MGWDFHKTNLARDATKPNNWESGKNSSLLLLITGIAISANSIKDEVTEATVLTNKRDGFPTWRLLRGSTRHLLRFSRFPPRPPGALRKNHMWASSPSFGQKQATGRLHGRSHLTRKGPLVRASLALVICLVRNPSAYAEIGRITRIREILKRNFSRD